MSSWILGRLLKPSRPSRRADDDMLPTRPPSVVCKTCWTGFIAAYSRLLYPYASKDPAAAEDITADCRTSLKKLEEGAAIGCVWCKAAFRLMSPASFPPGNDGSYMHVVSLTVDRLPRVRPLVPGEEQALNIDSPWWQTARWRLHTAADDPAAPYVRARDPVLNTRSPYAFSLAKARIDECVGTHEMCTGISPLRDVRLPTRVIVCTDPGRPRLVPTDGRLGKYLALSYVWGEAQPHQTTQANITAYLAGIDAVRLLPQTIRDAIYATHALGFQYLWVDSLCIIQDSDEDKLHELGRMHLIYRYASVTIIAACAKQASDGFLQERTEAPCITLPFICPPNPHRGGQRLIGSVRFSLQNEEYHTFYPTTCSRGWCLQEYLMSPRSLIYTAETIHLRCQSTVTNVLDTLYVKLRPTNSEQRIPPVLFHPDPPHAEHGSDAWNELCSGWWSIVRDYAPRTLGEPSDKLVACGAIAAAFHRGLRSDYLAGLWRGPTLLMDLLWQIYSYSNDPPKRRRPKTYRAPSWSWAAVDGAILPGSNPFSTAPPTAALAEVLDCQVELKDPELPFGQVVGGFLLLRAVLVRYKRRMYRSIGLNLDTRTDVDAARRGRIWLTPTMLHSDSGYRSQEAPSHAAGLVVMLAGRDETPSHVGHGKV